MKKNNVWFSLAIIITVFFSGAIAGFFAGRLVPPGPWRGRPGPPPSPGKVKAMLEHRVFGRLKLTETQQKTAMPAVDRWYDRMEKLRRAHAPDYMAVFMEFFDSLNPILSAEQRQELEKMRIEIREQHFDHRNRPEKPDAEDRPPHKPELP